GEEPGTDGFTALVESALRQASDRLDPAEGRMVDVVCLLPEPGVSAQGRALIVIHHLVVDGVSWRILLPDLATAWQRITAGQPADLRAPGTSLRRWAHALADAAPAREPEAPLWQRMSASDEPLLGRAPLDPALDTLATAGAISVTIPPEVTTALLHAVPESVRGTTDDALLAGLALAVLDRRRRRGGEHRGVGILLEGHGREEQLAAGADLSRTVGWFTSTYPVALDLTDIDPADPPAAVKAVKDQLRAIPDKGIGYGLLRHLHAPTRDRLAAA